MFGSFRWSAMGSGRGSIVLPELTPESAKEYIEEVPSIGYGFLLYP
ncbi:MAG: hypothetical protein GY714_06255 [Desulfobacterales bacterium]|nr:hypothetical protein [Desulfobacterales bacterium]